MKILVILLLILNLIIMARMEWNFQQIQNIFVLQAKNAVAEALFQKEIVDNQKMTHEMITGINKNLNHIGVFGHEIPSCN